MKFFNKSKIYNYQVIDNQGNTVKVFKGNGERDRIESARLRTKLELKYKKYFGVIYGYTRIPFIAWSKKYKLKKILFSCK